VTWTWDSERISAIARIGEALRAAKQAKKQGFNVQQIRATIRQAMSAFNAKDYATATQLADRAIEMCGGVGPLPYRGPVR